MLVYIIAVDSVRVDRVLKEAKYIHNNEETKNVYLYLECYVAMNCELRQFQNIRISFPQSILNDFIDVMAAQQILDDQISHIEMSLEMEAASDIRVFIYHGSCRNKVIKKDAGYYIQRDVSSWTDDITICDDIWCELNSCAKEKSWIQINATFYSAPVYRKTFEICPKRQRFGEY